MALCSEVEPPGDVLRMAGSRSGTLLVNACAIDTRLSKSTTCAKSCRAELLDEADGRVLRRLQLVFHARARVEQHRQRDGQVRPVEEGDLLLDAVLEDREGRRIEIGDEPSGLVGDRDVERHEIDPGAERRLLGARRDAGVDAPSRPRQHASVRTPAEHLACHAPDFGRTIVARVSSPGRFTLTSNFLGGTSAPGRPYTTLYCCVEILGQPFERIARAPCS